MNRDQALSKIKKCLALAQSSNPHEAAAAMRQAQKLMAEHNLSESDVSLADVTEVAARARHKTITPWETILAEMIAGAFGCEYFNARRWVLTAGLNRTRQLNYMFVGVGAAPQIAAYAYQVLSLQCAKDRLAHIRKQPKACKPITKTARGDEFAWGWVSGVRRKVEAIAGTQRDQVLIAQYIAQHHPDMKTTDVKDRTKGRNVSHNDRYQGYQAGQSANLNKGVGAAAQPGLLT